MHRFIAIAAGVFVFLCATALPAKTPEDRIAALERQIADLQKTYMANNQDVASSLARVQAIQSEFTAVQGQAEAAQAQLKALREEIMRLVQDLQQRVQSLEERMRILSTGQPRGDLETGPRLSAEALAYQKALDQADGGGWLEAAAAFESFLQQFPKSKFAPNARYWVAECFYSSRDYKRAIKEFQGYIEKYPRDAKVPDAIFKQGSSFYELGLYDESRAFFEKVLSAYPKSDVAAKAKAKLARVEDHKGKAQTPQAAAPAKYGAPEAHAPPGGGDLPPVVGSGLGTYPTETIEQQRQKMRGGPPVPETPAAPTGKAQVPPPNVKKPGPPPREF